MTGKLPRTGFKKISLASGDQQLISGSESRVELVICPPSWGAVSLSIEGTVSAWDGVTLKAGDKPIIFRKDRDGDLVTRPWRVIPSTIPPEPCVGETVRWTQTANAVNAVATATQAGVTSRIHFVTHVSGSFSLAATGIQMRLLAGASVIFLWFVTNEFELEFSEPISMGSGNAAIADLAAGGVGATGAVNIAGHSVDAQSITIFESEGT